MAQCGELALKINRLFGVMHKHGEPPLTTEAAAELISAQTGVRLSAADLARLRSGEAMDAAVAELRAIATFFGVPASFLTTSGTDPDLDAQLNLLRAMRDAGVQNVHMCRGPAPVGPDALNELAALLDGERPGRNIVG
ncbi:Nucleoid-associated protein EspR [Mycobacterium talmoniae]|uniref:Nucleoid-associated protein EspR n=1 Tax=Mycobacterium talmoniae TaxID=1858794 RepID=A0A2S8BR50_9MYCO|nr:XRE family transcriptional regulator [Mycobacterium eburneum]PQM49158.1 Nucleoid-associated protein EspR [Mycobacterium talmoniae]